MDEIYDLLLEVLESGEELSDEFMDQVIAYLESQKEISEPIPDNAKLLWELSGGNPDAFVSYLREFEDPTLSALLSNPSHLNQTISDLQSTIPIERNQVKDGFKQADLQSSNVYGFKFDPKNKRLKVRFQGGSVYEYGGVPDVIFNLFASGNASAKTKGRNKYGSWFVGKNPSLGSALNQYIKAGKYPYKKLR